LSYSGANAAVALHIMPMLKTNPFAVSYASDFCGVVSVLASIFFQFFFSIYCLLVCCYVEWNLLPEMCRLIANVSPVWNRCIKKLLSEFMMNFL